MRTKRVNNGKSFFYKHIRIKVKSRIRIQVKSWMQIRNNA